MPLPQRSRVTAHRGKARIPVGNGSSEYGGATVEMLMVMLTALLITVFMFNAVFMLYARSVMQHAADVGARSAARPGGTEAICEVVATDTIENLAALYADHITVSCNKGSAITSATVLADLRQVFGDAGPRWRFTIRATVVTEPFT